MRSRHCQVSEALAFSVMFIARLRHFARSVRRLIYSWINSVMLPNVPSLMVLEVVIMRTSGAASDDKRWHRCDWFSVFMLLTGVRYFPLKCLFISLVSHCTTPTNINNPGCKGNVGRRLNTCFYGYKVIPKRSNSFKRNCYSISRLRKKRVVQHGG